MYNFTLYDKDLEAVGELQNTISIIWVERFKAEGEIKIFARLTEDNQKYLIVGNYLTCPDFNTIAKICNVKITEENQEKVLEVRAFTTIKMLEDRVIMQTQLIDNIYLSMVKAYNENQRGLPFSSPDISLAPSYKMTTEITWATILEMYKKVTELVPIGYHVYFDKETKKQTLILGVGTDRSKQNNDYIGYLGEDLGNIFNIEYENGDNLFKNIAIVAGEDSGINRIIREVKLYPNIAQSERRELYVDARDIRSKYQVKTPTGKTDQNGNLEYTTVEKEYTQAEYFQLLQDRGIEKLKENTRNLYVYCDVAQTNIVFGKDYFLGDTLPVQIGSLNIKATATVTDVTIVYENETKQTTVKLTDFTII